MATPTSYFVVISKFLTKITDDDLILLDATNRNSFLESLLLSAIIKFKRISKIDLDDRDTILKQFNQELDDEVIEILSELMVLEWLKPRVYSIDNLFNTVSTREISQFSNAALLKEIKSTYVDTEARCKQLIYDYSYNVGDISELFI